MSSATPHRDLVEAALREIDWIAPGVTREILELDWESVDESSVGEYLNHTLPLLRQWIEPAANESAFFQEYVSHYSQPGVLEGELNLAENERLLEWLEGGLSDWIGAPAVTHQFVYLVVNGMVGIMAQLCVGAGFEQLDASEREILAVAQQTQLCLQAEQYRLGLQRVARHLNLPGIDQETPTEILAECLRNKIDSNRRVRNAQYLSALVQLLSREKLPWQVLVVGRCFFDWDYRGEPETARTATIQAAEFQASVAHRVELLTQFAGQPDPEGHIRAEAALLVSHWVHVLKALSSAEYRLVENAGSETPIPLFGLTAVSDALMGYAPGGPLNLAHLDLFFRLNPGAELLNLISTWLRSLEERRLLHDVCGQLVEGGRSADGGLPYDWWQRPQAVGRTVLLGCVVLFEVEHSGHHLSLLEECFPDLENSAWEIGALLGSEPAVASQAAGGFLIGAVAWPLFQQRNLRLLTELAGGFIHRSAGGDFTTLRANSQLALDRSSLTRTLYGIGSLTYGLQLFSLTLQGEAAEAQTLVAAMFYTTDDPPEFDNDRILAVRELSPSLSRGIIGALAELNRRVTLPCEFHQLLERMHGLPDGFCQLPDSVLGPAIEKLLFQVDDPDDILIHLDILEAIAIEVSELYHSRLAVRLLETAMGVWNVPTEELRDGFQNLPAQRRAIWGQVLLRLFGNLSDQPGYTTRYLTLLEQVCERDEAGNTLWLNVPMLPVSFQDSLGWILGQRSVGVWTGILMALRLAGRSAEAARELQRLEANQPGWLVETCTGHAEVGLGLAVEAAQVFVDADPGLARELYEFICSRLGEVYRFEQTEGYNRYMAARWSENVRQDVIGVGNSLAARETGAAATGRRVSNLLADGRLAQQTLMLRCEDGRPDPQIPDGPDRPRLAPVAGTAFQNVIAAERSWPDGGRTLALGQTPSGRQPSARPRIEFESLTRQAYNAIWDFRWEEEFTEQDIARSAEYEDRLLRTGFTLDGALVWTLFHSRSGVLEVVGHDQGTGRTTDREQLRRTVRKHDWTLDAVWDWHAWDEWNQAALQAGGTGYDPLAFLQAIRTVEYASRQLNDNDLAWVFGEITDRRWPLQRLVEQFEQRFGGVNPEIIPPEPEEWRSWWEAALEAYQSVAAEAALSLDARLDQATWTFLRELSEIFPVRSLRGLLNEDDCLVIWADGELLGVPIAFLIDRDAEGRETFLFEQVQTVRTIVSPRLDQWMEQQDWRQRASADAIIGSMIWLGANNPLNQYTEQACQAALADLEKQSGYEWWPGTGEAASHDALARGLMDVQGAGQTDARPLALLMILGHGSGFPHGVELADGIWDGSTVWVPVGSDGRSWRVRGACDLTSVDFLVQLSCSIGRLQQNGYRDVNGFCTELFLNRVRSVVAGRWLLHSRHGIEFGRALGEEYLARYTERATEARTLAWARVRGEALAEVRRNWVAEYRRATGTSGNGPGYGLNTLANMDLYGLA